MRADAHIGLDARSIFSPRPRGTGRNLFDAYRLLPGLRPDWCFTLYHQRRATDCPLVSAAESSVGQPLTELRSVKGEQTPHVQVWPANVRTRRLRMPGDRLEAWFQVRLPLAAWLNGSDLLHLPASAAPAWSPVPLVVTIHDLIPLKVRGELSTAACERFLRGVSRAIRQAVHIIAPSQTTRDDLRAQFNVPPERITIIPWAPDNAIVQALSGSGPQERDDAELRTRYDLTRPWLLNFSGNTPRKNATALIEALAQVSAELREQYLLVLVGCNSVQKRAELFTLAQALGVATHCRILPFVPHPDLPGLLRGARALLIPSLYEGFGLPILDALAAGVPVLAAQSSSLPEVAGEAAVYCDPHSPHSIASGIARVLQPDTAAELIRKGHQRVRAFTWERTARALLDVYERCLPARARARAAVGATTCP